MIHYRAAEQTDLEIILQLVQEFHHSEKLGFDEKLDAQALEELISDSSLGKLLLIQQDDEIIGYVIIAWGYSLEFRGRDAFIDEFYLRPQYRQQGIGTQTLSLVEKTCQELGIQALHLEVDFENPNAQRLYHRVGYQRHNRFLMTKILDN
ncbi:GNAT family N-acetyltransferase [Roseofilum sp. BLCC_M154]|uniref:GNAT family N-acetyltransferase n=1 Tax=Roseofilum acuticapitatum BLCC-M154 TaxID=3022444 RepID=A0ABT7AZJ6_9CYAN|nr:GNAT family N-acetyltransferase [Roseofilum acuticapitatum]MDJ1172329.1 GNAT family N-acetyltransferase [Roseofilum acuticapitatum BLCC-M154]